MAMGMNFNNRGQMSQSDSCSPESERNPTYEQLQAENEKLKIWLERILPAYENCNPVYAKEIKKQLRDLRVLRG